MIKILIVEDEAGIRNSLAKAFPWHEMGCELIDAADSGISALAMCMKNQPDIIISDIVMPGVDGLTFLRYVREQYPETQFINLDWTPQFRLCQRRHQSGCVLFPDQTGCLFRIIGCDQQAD